jgi:hypothetical protein
MQLEKLPAFNSDIWMLVQFGKEDADFDAFLEGTDQPMRLSIERETGLSELIINGVSVSIPLEKALSVLRGNSAAKQDIPDDAAVENNTTCQRCMSDLVNGRCIDSQCPFSDHDQTCLKGWIGHPLHSVDESAPCGCVRRDDRPDENPQDAPGSWRDESHGPTCAMRFTSAAECTCGKADRMSEEDEKGQ